MTIWLILKALIVVFFLIMFLRRPNWVWGIGLLTVTTAVLLDTFLGAFGRQQTADDIGFFLYVIGGTLVGGAALWLWGLLHPLVNTSSGATAVIQTTPAPAQPTKSPPTSDVFDRQMLYDTIRQRLGREDILDLMYDLRINENDIVTLNQDMDQVIVRLMDYAIQNGQDGELALAVERILTPLPTQNLPRLEKITADSPPTILRHYLLAHYDIAQLTQMAEALEIDWELISVGNKKNRVRSLLLYLQRRNRLDDLIDQMKQSEEEPHDEPETD